MNAAPSLPLLFVAAALLSACTSEPPLIVAVDARPSVVDPVLRSFAAEITAKIETVAADSGAEFDVLWDSDPRRAVLLKRQQRLAPLPVELRELRPEAFRDPDGYWQSLTADVRVIAYDPARITEEEAPTHVRDLAAPRWLALLALSDPARGAAAWHAAALAAAGDAQTFKAFTGGGAALRADEREVLRALSKGDRPLALVDGEQAFAARERGERLGILIPDQNEGGAVLRASVVALSVRGAANPNARKLAEYLLSPSVARRLALMTGHVVLLSHDATSGGSLHLSDLKVLPVSQAAIAERLADVPNG